MVFKTVTLDARRGNPPPRLHEIRGGLLNSIGIPSLGLDAFLRRRRAQLRRLHTVRIISVAGFAARQYAEACRRLEEEDVVDAIELNLSCPNIETDSVFATDIAMLEAIVSAARRATSKPLIAKLAPNVPDIRAFVQVAEVAGADMLCIANTFSGLGDRCSVGRTPILGNVVGGVSSPALLPDHPEACLGRANGHRTPDSGQRRHFYHADDAIQYLLAGANAVQIGTANYGDPIVMARVAAGIQDHLTRAGLPDIAALSGRANPFRGAQPRGSRTGVGTERTVMTRRSPFVANSARLEGLLRAFDLSGRTPFGLDRLALSPRRGGGPRHVRPHCSAAWALDHQGPARQLPG